MHSESKKRLKRFKDLPGLFFYLHSTEKYYLIINEDSVLSTSNKGPTLMLGSFDLWICGLELDIDENVPYWIDAWGNLKTSTDIVVLSNNES